MSGVMGGVTFRAKVYREPEGWTFEVLEPDDDGYYAKVTDRGTRPTWREAFAAASWWVGESEKRP